MEGPFYFAWAGGAVQDQITLVTTGTTHGSQAETVSIVGDTELGSSLVINLANPVLEPGVYYRLSGPGIAGDTYFQFDDSILSGPPGTLVLSNPAILGGNSKTFTATRASIIGAVEGTLLSGSNILTLPGADLPPGTYAIAGTGIGETDTPITAIKGTTTTQTITTGKKPIMIIGSALLSWNGAQGQMFVLVAQATRTDGTDSQTGMPTQKTTYSVVAQDVRATSTGHYPILITGFPDITDQFLVDDIPAGVLIGLEPGLVYNINGNGIPLGATFIAPNGGTSLELDEPAEGSMLGGIVTITGPRTPTEPFSPTIHNHNDEDLLSIEIEEQEGSFATLTVTMKNPGIGLLAAGRSLWCWLSWDQAWTPEGTNSPDLVPLFNGRLIGAPRRQAAEIVQLQFLARPDDFNAQKNTLTESLRVLPYYDPVWIASATVTPDTVLEAYSALWHIDPVSLAVTISDILQGEDGIVSIGEDQAIYESFVLSYGPPALDAVNISGTVSWNQQAEGFIDVTPKIVQAFKDAGSPYGKVTSTLHDFSLWAAASRAGSTGGLISCLCGDGLLKDWPKPGTQFGGGWSLATLNDSDGIPLCYIEDATKNGGGWLKNYYYNVTYAGTDQTFTSGGGSGTLSSNVQTYEQVYGQYGASFPLNVYVTRMTLQYKANRKRTETVSAVLTAGVQRILSDSSEQDRAGISVSSQYVGEAVDIDGTIPIGNLAYRSYFQTDRGARSFEYLLLLARAKMRLRARAVDIEFGTDWRTALAITLRHSVEYSDRRVPGGIAVGKVKARKLCVENGKMYGAFKIGCAAGTGDVLVLAESINSYVDTGYVSDGYQTIIGQVPLNDDIGYQALTEFSILDDGLDLGNMTPDTAVNECAVTNGLTRQYQKLLGLQFTVSNLGSPLNAMTTIQTTCTLDVKPVTGSGFHSDFLPDVAPLALPKLIDLSAPSQG